MTVHPGRPRRYVHRPYDREGFVRTDQPTSNREPEPNSRVRGHRMRSILPKTTDGIPKIRDRRGMRTGYLGSIPGRLIQALRKHGRRIPNVSIQRDRANLGRWWNSPYRTSKNVCRIRLRRIPTIVPPDVATTRLLGHVSGDRHDWGGPIVLFEE